MTDAGVRLQPLVRARVTALGDEGRVWADALPGRLDDLCRRWSLRLGRRLSGGSASYLTTVLRADGSGAVLKVPLPEPDPGRHAAALRSADGHGYVRLLEADPATGALLLERLGPSLDHAGLGTEDQLDALAATLLRAWRTPARPPLDKAASLAAGIRAFTVRDFSSTLLAEPTTAAARLASWCRVVAAPSGTDPERVRAWGFLERVSTGLYVTSFGAPRVGAPFLRSAELLVELGRARIS